jgi:hypothetical protein
MLGGKDVNRFSTFVQSGAESFILEGGGSSTHNGGGASEDGKMGVGGVYRKRGKELSTSSSIADEEEERGGVGEADRHFVESGPNWKAKSPPFTLTVHSPSKRKSNVGLSEYTVCALLPFRFYNLPFPRERQLMGISVHSCLTQTSSRRPSHLLQSHHLLHP